MRRDCPAEGTFAALATASGTLGEVALPAKEEEEDDESEANHAAEKGAEKNGEERAAKAWAWVMSK